MVRAIVAGTSRRLRILYATLSSLVAIVLLLGLDLIVSAFTPTGQNFQRSDCVGLLVVTALLVPIILIMAAQSFIERRRREEGWSCPTSRNPFCSGQSCLEYSLVHTNAPLCQSFRH